MNISSSAPCRIDLSFLHSNPSSVMNERISCSYRDVKISFRPVSDSFIYLHLSIDFSYSKSAYVLSPYCLTYSSFVIPWLLRCFQSILDSFLPHTLHTTNFDSSVSICLSIVLFAVRKYSRHSGCSVTNVTLSIPCTFLRCVSNIPERLSISSLVHSQYGHFIVGLSSTSSTLNHCSHQ